MLSRGGTGTIEMSSVGEVTGIGRSHLIGLDNDRSSHMGGTSCGRSDISGMNNNGSGIDKIGRDNIRETIY